MAKKQLHILISAYACEPEKGSEPGVGWNLVKELSQHHQLWVMTRRNNKLPIEQALKNTPLTNVIWIYYDLPGWLMFWKKKGRGVRLYYHLWQIGIFFKALQLIRKVKFDLVHHITFVNYWLPTYLFLLPIPFIWGPVGGGETTPVSFLKTFSFRGVAQETLRVMVRKIYEYNPFIRLTAKKAQIALATSEETQKRLVKIGCKNVHILSQVALSEEEIIRLNDKQRSNSDEIIFLSIGRLIYWKGFHLGLQAFALLLKKVEHVTYWIIGDGPEKRNLKTIAKNLGIEKRVIFWGHLERKDTLEKITQSHILVHPSLHESGGFVIAEAMAAGKPVICLDLGGPALLVSKETGIKIPAITPSQAIKDMAQAMQNLVVNSDLREKKGQLARKRIVDQFIWKNKIEIINRIYRDSINFI